MLQLPPPPNEAREAAWLRALSPQSGPPYLQLADTIERALADGSLRHGERLPPQRRVAELLHIDLTTVTRGYEEAKRRHLLVARGSRGTYAAEREVELHQMVDLGLNLPPPPAGLDFDDMLKRGMAQVLQRSDADQLMSYHVAGGSAMERAAGALWLRPMLPRLDPGHLLVCHGAQAALAALILTLSEPGEALAAEAALYPGLRRAAAQLGRRIVTIAGDADGMRPDLLEQACRQGAVRAVYLNPTLQNPTAHTMPLARRLALLEVAARYAVPVIEDDPYWLLAADAPPPLARLMPPQVCYVSTLSKCLSPGLRTAYVVLSSAALRERFLTAVRAFSMMVPPLPTSLATHWIHDGSAQQLLAAIKEEAAARRALAASILARTCDGGHDGIHLWLPLPGYWSALALAQAAQSQGVAVAPADRFYDAGQAPNAIRVSLGSIRARAQVAVALRKLTLLLARRPGPPASTPGG